MKDYAADGGNNYLVKPGEVWRAGQHYIACGDLEAGDGIAMLNHMPRPTLAYVDPPWTAGLARSFRTKSGLDGARGRPVNFQALLEAICQAVAPTSGHVFIAMGVKQTDLLHGVIKRLGGTVLEAWPIKYYGKKPCTLTHAAWWAGAELADTSPAGLDDAYTPQWAIARFSNPSDVVWDCCAGRGLTAVSAHNRACTFMGVELHPNRVSVTLTKLAGLGCDIEPYGKLQGY